MPAKLPSLVLDQKQLNSLASDPTFQRDFGFPAPAASKSGCTPCQKRAAARVTDERTAAITSRILALSDTQKIAFKNRLNTERVTFYRLEAGKLRQYSF